MASVATHKPWRVGPGDTVAVVSPSFGAVGRWPHRAERATAYLESLGLRVRIMPNAASSECWVSASPEARADDLHAAFSDDDVAVVLASIGGNHSNQVLSYLDYELIADHPKIFQGFSDMTVLHWAFLKHAGLSTFYGPAFTLALAEYPEVLPHTDGWLRSAWFGDEPLAFEPATEWTHELLDFDAKADLTRARVMQPASGWKTIRSGAASGPLLGGCLETIGMHLKGSTEWLDLAGAVLFIETSEESPYPASADAYLTDLRLLGVFDEIAGLIVGRPYKYGAQEAATLWRLVEEHTAAAGVPVLADFDVGHTDPMLTLPLGVRVELDAGARSIATTEAPTRERRGE